MLLKDRILEGKLTVGILEANYTEAEMKNFLIEECGYTDENFSEMEKCGQTCADEIVDITA